MENNVQMINENVLTCAQLHWFLHYIAEFIIKSFMGECSRVDRALDSRSKGLGFNSDCWSCLGAQDKLLIPCRLHLPSSHGYLME